MATLPTARGTGAHRRRAAPARPAGARSTGHAAGPEAPEPWERPALAGVLTAAALLYGWGLNRAAVHPYYGAAIRSMAGSWRAFVFGGLDSSGTITLDKVPGAFWPDAACVWLFGPHTWAAALPHVVEGVLTVYLLHRFVRAWMGPVAALIAALALTATPVTAVLNRATIPDTLLTLLLVLSVGSLQKALRSGRLLPVLGCAAWVGLAFQAKMLQAWVVLPVLGVVYLLAAPGGLPRRIGRVLLLGVTALAVSCSWVLLVMATPAADRPYLDGTTNNNPFTLVFGYNGISRFGSDPSAFGAVPGTAASRTTGNTGWGMIVNSTVGPQVAWLLPLALAALVLGLLWRARRPRTDPVRAGYLIWGGWLAIHIAVFSSSNGNHAYYTAVLAPALAALSGAGLTTFWDEYRAPLEGWRKHVLPVAVAVSAAWALKLDSSTLFDAWLLPVEVMLALCCLTALLSHGQKIGVRVRRGGFICGVAATLVLPAGWAVATLDPFYSGASTSPLAGPVGSVYSALKHHRATISKTGIGNPNSRDTAVLSYLEAHRGNARYLVATQAAYTAEPLLRASSEPMLVMGGFTGLTPFPSAAQFGSLVAAGQVRYAMLTSARPDTAASTWVKAHCTRVPSTAYGRPTDGSFALYDCHPSG
jgi:4-amino-4-deoxy-L-arabinose transferase-like glycosyltransferase